jgi:hypothetical protein
MTLIMSIIKPEQGVWQSADHRLTPKLKPKYDDARKQVALRCRDGSALLSYTGLAFCWPGHLPVSDLIRQLLRGDNRPVEGHLDVLRAGLDRYVARTRFSDEMLIIHVVAFIGGGVNKNGETVPGKPWLFEIANREKDPDGSLQPTPQGRFTFKRVEVTGPVWAIGGSGQDFLSAADAAELDAALQDPPGTRDLHELLAAVNRRIARDPASGVSPWCQTWSLPASGPDGFDTHDHRLRGEPPFDQLRPAPFILFGLDVTEIVPFLVRRVRLLEQGRGEDDPEFQALDPVMRDVIRQMITPRQY